MKAAPIESPVATAAPPPQAALDLASLGQRLREARERQALTLRELARRVGVSPSLVSQIERGLVAPSVGTLWSLTSLLGVPLDGLFGESARTGEAAEGLATVPGGPVQRAGDRKRIRLAGGVQWERLTAVPDDEVEFFQVVYDVGAESCPADSLFRHGGKEYAVVISGRLGLQIGFEQYELGPGDSVSFSAEMPHRLWAIGPVPAVAIWTVIRRTNDRRF